MDNSPDIRVGEAERNSALDRLSELFTNGYLDVAEFDRRTGEVVAATYRSDLTKVFSDLPEQSIEAPEQKTSLGADAELDRIEKQGAKVRRADGVIWTVVMVAFVLGLFVFNLPYFWIIFPLGAFASWGVRSLYGLEEEDEKIFEELDEAQKKERSERLRIAMERRKELGQ
ncbi:DUF1707 SHOCT-like domain-containing protein [Corynebacterium lubricantis]|uniref:DUF1707 SHOCT-like domain-containing protein n=1 Tax=Corynebacterium lubricantis TaxID=541095 RepID=UPI00035E4A76|nr:DUF1707 domain-containing protein [Corynebacterium lubricantis]